MLEQKPSIIGPITGGEHGWAFGAYFGEMKQIGYIEEEYFMEGIASRYMPVNGLDRSGKWVLKERESAPYKTRLLVRRPMDESHFNGTILLEWANVSAGYEITLCDSPGIYEKGFAYVSVSAQPLGLDGFPKHPHGLKIWDSTRYGSLNIPDEGVCYDIFTQAAQAVRSADKRVGADPLGGLTPQRLIGLGGSQSGTRILSYANGVQPLVNVFDALMPMLNAGMAADFDDPRAHPDRASGERGHSRSVRSLVREDLKIPVLAFNTESEAFFYSFTRQQESSLFRSWEIAGAAHMSSDQAKKLELVCGRDGMRNPYSVHREPHASDVPWLDAFEAAVFQVHNWLITGEAPDSQSPMEINLDQKDVQRDKHGNGIGGVRLPALEVPTAQYVAGAMLRLGGFTLPFGENSLCELYSTHENYVQQVIVATEKALENGVLLKSAAQRNIAAAEAAPIPCMKMPDLKPTQSQNE